jgi:hypothetical protein
MKRIWSIGLAALLAVACRPALAANPFDDLMEPVDGKSACFTRVYDAAHLKRNSRQKTTAMTVWLRYEAPPGSGASGPILSVSLAITQRGDPAAMYSDGGCSFDERANRNTSDQRLIKTYPKDAGMVCLQSAQPDVFDATSAEEGGDLILDRSKDRDTLMVYLDDSLIMVKRANRSKHLLIKFGPDDRVFLLRRAVNQDCDAIQEAVTTPEPGAPARRR